MKKPRPSVREYTAALLRRGAITLLMLTISSPVVLRADDADWRTGSLFRAAMIEPLSAKWQSVPLRDVLERISLDRQVVILLDRRIDPTRLWPVEFVNEPLEDGLMKLARQFDGQCSLVNSVAYLGPADPARKLRTLIALRSAELSSPELKLAKNRQQTWLQLRTIHWNDLDSPREILASLLQALDVDCGNLAEVEHDLWREGEWPQVTGVEALSLLLVQFDLTFAWRNGGRAIELVPIPEVVRIERTHKPRGQSAEKAIAEWQSRWPNAEFQAAGTEINVLATVEEHEELAGGRTDRVRATKPGTPASLRNEQFTLRIKDTPVQVLMAELEKSGVVFDYDEQELAQAGISLKKMIELDVRKLPAEEFFMAVFGPLGLKATIDGQTVKLRLK